MKHTYALLMLAVMAASSAQSSTMLPTTGRVYRESIDHGALTLFPASGIEVLAERINVCEKKRFSIGETSTTGIDSFIVMTDADGYYHLPQRSFTEVCSYVVLSGTAISPYMHSISAVAAKNPVVGNPKLYGSLGDSDAVIKEAAKGRDRIEQLSGDLNSMTGSYAVSDTVREKVYFRYFQEICALHRDFPKNSASLYESTLAILGKQCD